MFKLIEIKCSDIIDLLYDMEKKIEIKYDRLIYNIKK